MKQAFLLFIAILLFFPALLFSQAQVPNGGFEAWSGIDTIRPDGWITTEQMQGLHTTRWVKQETRPGYFRTGTSSIRLIADTIHAKMQWNSASFGTYKHLTGTHTDTKSGKVSPIEEDDLSYMPGVIAAGRMVKAGDYIVSTGVALNARPATFSFYVRTDHPVADTAAMRLLLTRWNPSRGTQDTMAYDRRYIFPDSMVMSGFALFTDTIDYRLLGDADTTRIIIYGGRMKNEAARGNSTWIDGVTFGYGLPAAPRSSALADSMWLTPNPVINTMEVKCDLSLQGYKIIIQAETSVIVKEITLSQLYMKVDMTDLPAGNYPYALIDREERKVRTGYISVMRN